VDDVSVAVGGCEVERGGPRGIDYWGQCVAVAIRVAVEESGGGVSDG
jgi:hypothetical protein